MAAPTQNLRRLNERRTGQRDARLRAIDQEINRWSLRIERQILGIVAANIGGLPGVTRAINVLLDEAVDELAVIVERQLRDMWDWGWLSATQNWIGAVPLSHWVARLLPSKTLLGTEATRPVATVWEDLRTENELKRIIDGEVTAARARELVRELTFPPPSAEQVDKVISDTFAADGMSAMQRIRTVLPKDIEKLRQTIVVGLAGDTAGADAVRDLARSIRPLVGNDPGKTTGMNYRARRIARTEATRVSEASLRESWKEVGDLIMGIRTFTANDQNVRDSHRKWENKLFLRRPGGEFVAADGELLPVFPVAPNCRGWSTPELHNDITTAPGFAPRFARG